MLPPDHQEQRGEAVEGTDFRTAELDPTDEILVYGHGWWAQSGSYLRGLGFTKAVNLARGLDLWARTVAAISCG